MSIIGYYCNYYNYDLVKCSTKVLNYPYVEEAITKNVLSNYKFYAPSIFDFKTVSPFEKNTIDILKNVAKEIDTTGFKSSSPSLCINNDNELILITRFVDYTINEKGGYENTGKISTKNVVSVFDISNPEEWELSYEFLLNYDSSIDNLYVGLEDVRIFSRKNDDNIYFNANRGLDHHNIKIEHGIISFEEERVVSNLLKYDEERTVEKNWVLFENSHGNIKSIYNWYPLIIGEIEEGIQFRKTNIIQTPKLFSHFRGSTNGIKIGNEIWFICHIVSYEDRRYYYHVFIVLDATTFEVIKYTSPWTFNRSKVEYTLGFVYFEEDDEFLIGYSQMDSSTNFMKMKRTSITSWVDSII